MEVIKRCRFYSLDVRGCVLHITHCPCEDYNPVKKPKTNADRIRSMTDEELAEFLDRWELGDIDYAKTFCDLCNGQFDCHNDCLVDWLKQECDENGT